jgi:hypothetical protein
MIPAQRLQVTHFIRAAAMDGDDVIDLAGEAAAAGMLADRLGF